jgi:hypothetical protein
MALEKSLRILIVLLFAVSLAPSAALAQSARGELKDVAGFKVRTAGFGQASAFCGLSQAGAIDAFSTGLENSGVGLLEQASSYWVSLRVTTLVLDEATCITYVETAVFQTARYINTATRGERVGKVQHWIDGGLFASVPSVHQRSVLRSFRDLGARLGLKWQKDQETGS